MEKKVSYMVQEADVPYRVQSLLKIRMGLTKAQIKSAKYRPMGICKNGVRIRVNDTASPGDLLEVLLELETDQGKEMQKTEGSLEILYEDDDVIAVNKAAGIPVHPGHGHYGDTLANHLLYYYEKQGICAAIRSVGRLDKDTSGIVLFAKNRAAAARLSQAGKVQKEYLALVLGELEETSGKIELPIGRKKDVLNQMMVCEHGNFARTHYQVVQSAFGNSLVRLKLDTGRTHQIRVHMAALGHPLLGDPIYGSQALEKEGADGLTRAALHCSRVLFCHPFTQEMILCEAPLPLDMQTYLSGKRTSAAQYDENDLKSGKE